MSLVVYSDSDSEEPLDDRGPSPRPTKKLKLPDVPTDFFGDDTVDMKQPGAGATTQESELSKIRNVPHIKGNWATLVYIQIESATLRTWVHGAIQTLRKTNPRIQDMDDFHISLSRTVYLKEYQIDRFVQRISECFSRTLPFNVTLSGVTVYTNGEKTRTFAGIDVSGGLPQLLSLLGKVNAVMRDFHQPVFHENPKFHASFAWTNKDDICLEGLNQEIAIGTRVDCIQVQTGNRSHRIPLLY